MLAHDVITRQYMSSAIVFVGKTLVIVRSKRQSAVEVSVHGTKFNATRVATKDAIEIRHMLRSLGTKVN